MEFSGTFTLDDTTSEEVWLALSDPVMIKNALPGCQFLVKVDEENPNFEELEAEAETREDPPTLPEAEPETVAERAFVEDGRYAALTQISVGSVKPRFETIVTIDRREFPEMDASGAGNSSDSSFEMESGMTLTEVDDGVEVDWWAETDVFGNIANMGQRVMSPVANRIINRFFKQIQNQLQEVGEENRNLRDRVKGVF